MNFGNRQPLVFTLQEDLLSKNKSEHLVNIFFTSRTGRSAGIETILADDFEKAKNRFF